MKENSIEKLQERLETLHVIQDARLACNADDLDIREEIAEIEEEIKKLQDETIEENSMKNERSYIEEAIERLEYIDSTYSYNNYYSTWDLKCIEILLSDYKRVLKENEELKILKDDIQDKRIIYIDTPEFEENYISVQKIKGKIEELNNESNAENLEYILFRKNYTIAELVQYVLQELIEREEEQDGK